MNRKPSGRQYINYAFYKLSSNWYELSKSKRKNISQKLFNILEDYEKKLTLMHFTEEKNLLHFIYILPFSHNKALVESTVFSKNVFDSSWYREKI